MPMLYLYFINSNILIKIHIKIFFSSSTNAAWTCCFIKQLFLKLQTRLMKTNDTSTLCAPQAEIPCGSVWWCFKIPLCVTQEPNGIIYDKASAAIFEIRALLSSAKSTWPIRSKKHAVDINTPRNIWNLIWFNSTKRSCFMSEDIISQTDFSVKSNLKRVSLCC